MNPPRRVPVTLVVVDSGPLISLAAARRLDLLGTFARPVLVVDVAREECLRDLRAVGAADLAAWFASLDGVSYRVEPTPILPVWREAAAREAAGDASRPTSGLGDAAAAWLLVRLRDGSPGEVVLLLLEDAPFGDALVRLRHPEVYALSTRSFLQTLENFGVIPSAKEVILTIAAAGRTLARYGADRPGRLEGGRRTQWTGPLADKKDGPS